MSANPSQPSPGDTSPMIRCPYDDCPFEAETQAEVDDHVAYLTSFDEPDHAPDKLRDRR